MGWPFGRRVLRQPVAYPAAAGTWRAAPGGLRKLRAPPVVPMEAFTRRVSAPIGVDGQVSALMAGVFPAVSGTRTSPPAPFSLIFSTGLLPPGTYTVTWSVSLSGTIGAPEANNFVLNLGPSVFLAASVNAAAAGTYPQASVTFTTPGGLALLLLSGAAGATSGAVYGGSISTTGTVSLQAGPQGVGARWALDQAGIATSVGANDTATCAVYAGPMALAPFLVAQSYAGGGDAIGLAGYTLQPGEFVFAVWSGGVPGSLAQLKIAGTKTVLAA